MSDQLHITAQPNPIGGKPYLCKVASGQTIEQLFPDLSPQAKVMVNGEHLPPARYDEYQLTVLDSVQIIRFPQGGGDSGDKNVARTVALLAVVAAGSFVSGGGLGLIGGSQFLTTLAGGAIATAGSALVHTLIPPPQLRNAETDNQQDFNRMGALTGSRNRLATYKVVPRVYGKHRLYPPLAAKPYTEIFTNNQFLRLLFCVGYGPLKLSDPKIGDTAIGSFDADNVFTSNGNFEDIEIDVGEDPSLFSNTVSQESVNVDLKDTGDSGIRTTAEDTDEISLEIVFPQGLFGITENGSTTRAFVDVKIEIRETGTSTWEPAADGSFPIYVLGSLLSRFSHQGSGVYRANNSARETLRVGMSLEVDRGQYDIRVTRQTAKGAGDSLGSATTILDAGQWNVLRSIQHSNPTDLPGKVMIGMKVKATDQLNGILDNFSVVAESRLATSDGATWSEPTFDGSTGNGTGGALTANPAWVFADVLTGGANARGIANSRLDASALKAWADWCDAEGFSYNGVIDSETTVMQLARSVAAAGRASYGLQDGLHTVVRDLDGQTPVQMFTPRNSWGFASSKQFLDNPHGLKVQFRNEASDWKTEEAVVYNDGYSEDGTGCLFDDGTGVCKTATKFETLSLDGVTNWDQAWKLGRYRLAEARLRPETYRLNVDVENLICQRGDTVKVAHDVTLWGSRWGRIKSVTRNGSNQVTEIETDEPAIMEAGNAYQVRIRKDDGNFTVFNVDTVAGQTQSLTITTPATAAIAKGDLFAFGEQSTETVTLKVIGIEPRSDLSARLTLVDEAPAIHDADTGSIPAFNPQITDPLELSDIVPPAPRIEFIRSDEYATVRDNDGSYLLRISVGFSVEPGFPSLKIEGRYRKQSEPDTWIESGQVEPSAGVIHFQGVEKGDNYLIQIRSANGEKTSSWIEIDLTWNAITGDGDNLVLDGGDQLIYEDGEGHLVSGKKFPPRDVTNFTATIDKVAIRLSWDAVNSPDIKEYEVRKGASWDGGALVGRTDATTLIDQIDGAGSVTYHIKAIDTTGNYSNNATQTSILVPDEFDDLGNFYSYIIQQSNQIVLKIDDDTGNIAKVDLLGDPEDGTVISIVADDVNINGFSFDKETGVLTIVEDGRVESSGGEIYMAADGLSTELGFSGVKNPGDIDIVLETALRLGRQYGDPDDSAGLIAGYNDGATPTIDEGVLYLIGGYDHSENAAIGKVHLAGDKILIEATTYENNASTINLNGQVTANNLTAVGSLNLKAASAPGTPASGGFVYVDSADGDLKIVFANGTTKTIITDD